MTGVSKGVVVLTPVNAVMPAPQRWALDRVQDQVAGSVPALVTTW